MRSGTIFEKNTINIGKKIFCKLWLGIGMFATSECYQKSYHYGLGFFVHREVCTLKNIIVKTEVIGHLLVHLVQLKITQV